MTNEEAIKNGWSVCEKCGEIVGALVKNGLCYECYYLSNHPNAQKKFCKNCIHFRKHAVYDPNDKTECSCNYWLEAKDTDDYTYECKHYNEQLSFFKEQQ